MYTIALSKIFGRAKLLASMPFSQKQLNRMPNAVANHKAKEHSVARNEGFAIVIALSLMSIVLLMLVTLTALARVETQAAQIHQKKLLAKENARLGLMIALGSLQRQAGPDQRVTFTADALSTADATVQNPNWVGVVDTRSPTNDPNQVHWLVSHDPLNPKLPTQNLPDLSSQALIGAKLNDTEVRAPLQNIERSANQYAYWICDESIKASLATRPELDAQKENWLETSFGRTQAQRLDQVVPKRSGIELLFSPTTDDASVILNQLSKVDSVSQTPLMSAWEFTNYEDYIHAVTDRSYGLLASTTGTGLRSDLSLDPDKMPLAGAFEEIEDFKQYMETPLDELDKNRPYVPYVDDLRRRYNITAPQMTTDGDIVDGIAPVLTDFKLLMNIAVARSTSGHLIPKTRGTVNPIENEWELCVGSYLYLKLWNPYTSALVPENLVIKINNLPTLEVTIYDGTNDRVDDVIDTISVDLNKVMANGSSGSEGYYIELPFHDNDYPERDGLSWLPGRFYSWVGQNNYSNGEPKDDLLAKYNRNSLAHAIWYEGTGIITDTATRHLEIKGEATNLSVSLLKKDPDDLEDIEAGAKLFEISDIEYTSFNTPIQKYRSTELKFGFQAQRDESGFAVTQDDPAWHKSNWLRTQDPRSTRPTFDLTGERTGALLPPKGRVPSDYNANTALAVRQPEFIFDRSSGSRGLRPSEDIPLFELFRQRPLSIGELQHLKINNRRPFTIGNSWGSDNGDRYNRIFDEAFFSGLKKSDEEPAFEEGAALPNHRLRDISEITGAAATTLEELKNSLNGTSELLAIEGAFNLNSTSAEAWTATLGSIQLPNWEIANINDSNGDLISSAPKRTVELGQTLLRFPQSAQEVYHTGEYSENDHPPTEYFRVGAKTSKNTKDLMSYSELGIQVAERVAQRIQLLGPFTSIESFLSPVEHADFVHPHDPDQYLSVIERAILDVPKINKSAGEEIWYHTSSFLSQADVMTALAPIASVRGDTFTIRALGQTDLDISGGNVATALCEARVQRLPNTVDPNDPVKTPDPNGYGRRFVLTSIKWLNDG